MSPFRSCSGATVLEQRLRRFTLTSNNSHASSCERKYGDYEALLVFIDGPNAEANSYVVCVQISQQLPQFGQTT